MKPTTDWGMMIMNYSTYTEEVTEDIKECLNEMGTQPILFVGSGLSQRYFSGPSWVELLQELQSRCPLIPHETEFYMQDGHSLERIGSEYTRFYRDWAWSHRERFPDELFRAQIPGASYIKFEIKRIFDEITPDSMDDIENQTHQLEVELLRSVQPHAIITTNYDTFLETIFPDYQPIIGQQILRPDTMSIGEIYKIHGCISQYQDLVFNEEDYEVFMNKKKYLSAKLLTFFAEHPLLFIGYSGNDRNILSILADIDEIISTDGELIPNIYFVSYNPNLTEHSRPQREKVFFVNEKEIRVKHIEANQFDWVLEAFASNRAIENIHPKLLRAMLARMYRLVRTDIPRRSIQVNFEMLQNMLDEDEALPNLYGVTLIDSPSQVNLQFPYSLTEVGQKLGYAGWHDANALLQVVKEDKGINIKASDNKYHLTIRTGNKSHTQKYSEETLTLLEKVRDGVAYTVDI